MSQRRLTLLRSLRGVDAFAVPVLRSEGRVLTRTSLAEAAPFSVMGVRSPISAPQDPADCVEC